MDDSSLDEFLPDVSPESDDSDSQTETDPDETSTVSSTDGAVEPATATARWEGQGTCPECGDQAARLWSDDGVFVCRECKEW